MATIVSLVCEECNNEFTCKKGTEKKFCSINCKTNNRKKLDSIYYIEKNCLICNNLFVSKKKEHKKFCSYKCSGLHKQLISHENRYCLQCGNLFSERIKYERKFCSENCRSIWQQIPENLNNRLNKSKFTIEP